MNTLPMLFMHVISEDQKKNANFKTTHFKNLLKNSHSMYTKSTIMYGEAGFLNKINVLQ